MDALARSALERSLAALERTIAEAQEAAAPLRAVLAGDTARLEWGSPIPADVLPNDSRWIGTGEAAHLAGVKSESTIIRWCEERGVGEKFGGRWKVWQPALLGALGTRRTT